MSLARGRGFVASIVFLALLSLAVGLTGCGGASSSGEGSSQKTTGGGQTSGGTVTVLAAASLTDAFDELASTFEGQNPGAKVNSSFGASSALLTQIQQGAPADVFASADEAKMDTAVQDDLVNKPQIFARNRPVVIVPKDNPAEIHELGDLAKPGSKLVLEQDSVPIAEYSKQILSNANSEYGADFEQRVFDNIVSREADVRASANRVALGEADATFVYITDVTPDIKNQVEVIEILEDLNVVATYPIATLKQASNAELAQKWVDLVLSDEGQGVLEKYGFERVA